MEYFHKLRRLLDREIKRKLLGLIVFSIFVSIIEVIGVSAIMPFIDIATNFSKIHDNQYYQKIFVLFGFENDVDFAIAFGLVLCGFYIFRGGVNSLHSYVMAGFAENLYAQTAKKMLETYLKMPYQVFTNKNSSYLTKAIVTEASLMVITIEHVLVILSEIFVIFSIYILMLATSWKITLVFTAVLLIKILFLMRVVTIKVKTAGVKRANAQMRLYEIINRVFGNFEHIKLQDSSKLKAINTDFSIQVDNFKDASSKNRFLQNVPRIFIETVGFLLVILLLTTLLYLQQTDIFYILPTLSLFVLALYRLLPSANRIMTGYNTIMYYHKSIDIVDDELKTTQENLADDVIKFNQKIELINMGFSYQDKPTLKGVSLTINKGDKVAFVGGSGSGKSTLVNLIIGLYQPNQGEIRVDNVLLDESNLQNWRAQISYIPQHTYLFDGTIAQNVCFGREVNIDLLEEVLKQANIFDFLQTKQGIETLVGENGVQLSGGQKQRIAIARALYEQTKVLVLDEATSALDDETEKKVMKDIYQISQDKTLIIIAHRLSTINSCDKIYTVKDNSLDMIKHLKS